MGGLNPFKKPKIKIPEPPELPDPVLMPDPDDTAAEREQMRQMLLARQRSGRASTLLSSGDSADYGGSTLGIN